MIPFRKALTMSLLQPLNSAILIPKSHYVDVKMKWKKDPFYDSLQPILKSRHLKAIISLKNAILAHPNASIPVSAISKQKFQLEVPFKVSVFLRMYPSFFEESSAGPDNLPWFRLTREAIDLDREEQAVYHDRRREFADRVRRLILMSKEKKLPLSIIQGMRWYLGLPHDFLQDPGLRLKRKIELWLDEFQKLPYTSPYEDSSHLRRDSDLSEKRVVGVLHELFSLFVDHAAERLKLKCLQKHLQLPQKFTEVFVRHPHMFYLSLRKKTCTVILKEAYSDDPAAIEKHPILAVRKKYMDLMDISNSILRKQRSKQSTAEIGDSDSGGDTDSDSDSREEPCSIMSV